MADERKYLIVGGSSGIGLAAVRRLAEASADVWVASRSLSEDLEKIPGARHLPFDATTDRLDTSDLPEFLHGLVYCPGTINLRPFTRLSQEEFLADLSVNLLGAVNTIQATLPLLKKAPGGATIILFSTVAVQTGMAFHASVASAKGAVEGLTRALAAELAPGIRVNAIAPSLTDTPLAGPLLANEAKRKAGADRHPIKEIGNPDHLAALVCTLLAPEGRWITGQIIHADGGMSSLRLFGP